ncbi:50S ribosomal protein L25 [Patescibacteria group bacterium]|nr:50S ribosomal protein L25 [Patescibacteria group bacterium]
MAKTATDKVKLTVKPRELVGKKARKLRKDGLVLANVFGPDFKSQSISVDFKDFLKTYKIVKETGVVYLESGKEEIPALIRNVQRHPVSDAILHVDFRKIDLKKKIEASVPVKTTGVSEAVSQKGGVLLLQTETVLIEALPQDIPSEIEIDISVIKEIGQEIKVGDLKKSDKFEVKTAPEKVVVSVVEHKEESITPDTTAAAPEVIAEAPKEGEEAAATGTAETAKAETKEKPAEKKPQSPPPQK